MRICILHNSSPGGADRLVHEIAMRLARTDSVTVCTWGDAPVTVPRGVDTLWCPAPPIHLPPPLHPFANLARSYLGSARAARAVDRCGFDVALVLACQWGQAPEALRRLHTPHLYFAQEGRRRNIEDGYLTASTRAGWRRGIASTGRRCYDALGARLDRRAIASAAAVITNSEFTASQLAAAYGVCAGVIELGVDVDRFRPPQVRSRGGVAVLVGALDPSKGGELAVRSLGRVRGELRPRLHLIHNRGDDAYGSRLVGLGRECGVEVRLFRDLTDAALVEAYQSADLLLALAVKEPFGLTVLEASACGTPTVAVAEGGYCRTVAPGINGTLVGRDADEIARAIAGIIGGRHRFDEVAMSQWTASHWSWDRCVAALQTALVRASTATATVPAEPRVGDTRVSKA